MKTFRSPKNAIIQCEKLNSFSKTAILLAGFLLFSLSSFAQSWGWGIKGGGNLSDKACKMVMDAAGNSYVTGYYNEEATFGSIVIPFTNFHSKEVFVAKIDPNGNYLWVRTGENYYDDRGLGICLDPLGNVIVTGTCWGGLNFGTMTTTNSTAYTDQIYVLKLDNNGNDVWLISAGVDETESHYSDDHGHSVVSDPSGNIFITGFISNHTSMANQAHFGTLNIPIGIEDSLAFVGKLSSAGTWQWVRTFDGEDGSRDNRIALDANNYVYVVGGFRGTKTFGTSTISSVGATDVFVVKYDENGNYIYVQRAGSTYDDRADDIVIGPDNHAYITGEFRDKAGFGLDSINNNGGAGGKDIFVARMALDGTWNWAKKAGSNGGSDRGCGITMNNKYNIFVTGQFRGDATFGNTIALSSGTDSVQVFVAAIDTLGKWRWALQGGGPVEDRGTSIACDTLCNVAICGYYSNSASFGGITLPGDVKKDIFVAKISDACFGYAPTPEEPVLPTDYYCTFLLSNVFSPNGDGINDEYAFTSNCNAKSVTINIVNRWGVIVYENNDPLKNWDGKDQHGMEVSDGVYFYSIKADLANGKNEFASGFIQVEH